MKKIHGILFLILASVAFGVMPILAKFAYSGGANTYTTLFLRFIIASLMLFIYIRSKKISLKLNKKQLFIILALGSVGYSMTSIFLFMSYNYISVGLATMMLYTYPAIVTIMSFVIYKEKLYAKKMLCLALSVLGVYILIDLGNVSLNIKGILLALSSAIVYSIYVLGVSLNEIKKINSYVIIFYVSVVSSITTLIAAICTNNLNFHIQYYGLVSIVLLALISTVVALMTFLQGVKIIGPSNAAIFSTLEPIVSLILGVIILGEPLSKRIIIGSIFIVVSILILSREA